MYCVGGGGGGGGGSRVGLGPGGLLNKIKMSCYANIDADEIFMLRLIIWCLLR